MRYLLVAALAAAAGYVVHRTMGFGLAGAVVGSVARHAVYLLAHHHHGGRYR